MCVHWDSWVGDNPHCLEHECTSHCLPGTHFPLSVLGVLLQSFEDTLDYNTNLVNLFLKVSFGLSTLTWGRDSSMLSCFSPFLKTLCTLSNLVSRILGDSFL